MSVHKESFKNSFINPISTNSSTRYTDKILKACNMIKDGRTSSTNNSVVEKFNRASENNYRSKVKPNEKEDNKSTPRLKGMKAKLMVLMEERPVSKMDMFSSRKNNMEISTSADKKSCKKYNNNLLCRNTPIKNQNLFIQTQSRGKSSVNQSLREWLKDKRHSESETHKKRQLDKIANSIKKSQLNTCTTPKRNNRNPDEKFIMSCSNLSFKNA